MLKLRLALATFVLTACSTAPTPADVASEPREPASSSDPPASIDPARIASHLAYESQYGKPLVPDATCSPDPTDVFARGMRMPENSPRRGECVDNSLNRSSTIITYAQSLERGITEGSVGQTPSALRITDRSVWIANFVHQGKHWIAHVPFTGIERAILQSETTKGSDKGFHNQMRFIYEADSPGVRLFPQRLADVAARDARPAGDPARQPIVLRDIIVSSLGLRPTSLKGSKFSIARGNDGSYAASLGFLSFEDNAKELREIEDDIIQWDLSLNADERAYLLKFYAERAHRIAETRQYHFLMQNCIVEVFLGIDAVRPYRHVWITRPWRNSLTLEYDPGMVTRNLRQRELIGRNSTSRVPNVSQELNWGWPVK